MFQKYLFIPFLLVFVMLSGNSFAISIQHIATSFGNMGECAAEFSIASHDEITDLKIDFVMTQKDGKFIADYTLAIESIGDSNANRTVTDFISDEEICSYDSSEAKLSVVRATGFIDGKQVNLIDQNLLEVANFIPYEIEINPAVMKSTATQQIYNIQAEGGNLNGYDKNYETLHGCCGIAPEVEPGKVSSYLSSQGKNDYSIRNMVDDSPFTAWIEGAEGYGAGEYFEFGYEFNRQRGWEAYCDRFSILNGYQKSKKDWANNSRVKTLKMFVDGQLIAYIQLQDLMGEQLFSVPFLPDEDEGRLTIRFEIADIYPGKKWADTAISELYFSCGP